MPGKEQKLLYSMDEFNLEFEGYKNIFIICGDSSLKHCASNILENINNAGISYTRFGNFSPNPTTEYLENAIKSFNSKSFDAIFSIGGGSAIDLAKCVKLYANAKGDDWGEKFRNHSSAIKLPLIVMPTTAGSGSEATRFAVIYYNGVKQSINSDEIIPNMVFFDYRVLQTLSLYQRKATIFDALCHCVESYWSVNSTDESMDFSRRAIALILEVFESYITSSELEGDLLCKSLQKAAYYAGKAINITQTTAGHAMAYKITSMYGCPHGHAVALVIRILWPWMLEHIDQYYDPRGEGYLRTVFSELDYIMGCNNGKGADKFASMFSLSGLEIPIMQEQDLENLVESVNLERLKNNPVKLSKNNIRDLYRQILKES